jgi:predicted dehydrogenase
VLGTTGRIEIEIPVNAPAKRPCRIWHAHDSAIDELVLEASNQYTLQGDAFSRAIMDNTPVPTPLEDAVANMRVIDAIIRSGREGKWVEVSPPGA